MTDIIVPQVIVFLATMFIVGNVAGTFIIAIGVLRMERNMKHLYGEVRALRLDGRGARP